LIHIEDDEMLFEVKMVLSGALVELVLYLGTQGNRWGRRKIDKRS
jgi:hypothetical protein